MNVLSLFDGLSGGQIALDRLGIKVDNYYASEIDKYAISICMKNFSNTIQLGSVVDLTDEQLATLDIDLLIGGSPCQGFSVAGKLRGSATKEGLDVTSLEQYLDLKARGFEFDGQSYLFWEYVRVWKIVKPKYFFLENVRVTAKWLPMFNEAMGVEPICINSALVSAQNRVRYYWTNLPNLTQPEDRGIVLSDILEDTEFVADRDKAYCIDANYAKGGNPKQYFEKSRRQLVFRPCELREYKETSLCHHAANATDIKGQDAIKRVYADTGKSPALTTMQGGHREPKVLCGAMRGRYLVDGVRQDDIWYRKLTPLECERLQTLPDDYTEGVSNSQRYKMIGNGWTIEVIAHLFRGLL